MSLQGRVIVRTCCGSGRCSHELVGIRIGIDWFRHQVRVSCNSRSRKRVLLCTSSSLRLEMRAEKVLGEAVVEVEAGAVGSPDENGCNHIRISVASYVTTIQFDVCVCRAGLDCIHVCAMN